MDSSAIWKYLHKQRQIERAIASAIYANGFQFVCASDWLNNCAITKNKCAI